MSPSFTIPRSSVLEFFKHYHPVSGLRLGQAFHQVFKLEKMTQDKAFTDALYQADGEKAREMIRQITDENN